MTAATIGNAWAASEKTAATAQQSAIQAAYHDLAVAIADALQAYSVTEAGAATSRDLIQNAAQKLHDQLAADIPKDQQSSQWNGMSAYATAQTGAAQAWGDAVKAAAAQLKKNLNADEANCVNRVAQIVADAKVLETVINLQARVLDRDIPQLAAVRKAQDQWDRDNEAPAASFSGVQITSPPEVLRRQRAEQNTQNANRPSNGWEFIESGLNAITGGRSRSILLSEEFTRALNAIDGFFAGVADSLTAGLSTKLRTAMWGETATRNHTGGWFLLGQVVGAVMTIPLMAANPCSLGLIGNIGLRAINAMQLIGNGIGAVENIMAGNYLSAGLNVLGMLGNLSAMSRACFTGDTKIMARGAWGEGWRRIDQITNDDEVLSRDENDFNAPTAWKRVEETFVRHARIMNLHVRGKVIRTTGEHPFYVYNKGWLAVNELEVGDWLAGRDGQWVQVEDLCDAGEYQAVYNMRVADFHTYFVGEESWDFSVWAHNAYKLPPGLNGARKTVLDLSKPGWRSAKFNKQGLVYVLRDKKTGEILKVGQTTSKKFIGRFEKYVTAGKRNGRDLVLDVYETPLRKRGAMEGQLRGLFGKPPALPWDNASLRLGRPGPGVP